MILSYRSHTPAVHETAFVAENASVIGNVTLGKESGVWFGAVLRGDHEAIVIGERSNVQDNATLHMAPGRTLTVGKNVTIGHNAVVHGATVKDNVLIGMQACVLDGAVIGENSIIGAGALVKENEVIPPFSLCVGVPARVVRTLTPEAAQKILDNAEEYVGLAAEYKALQK